MDDLKIRVANPLYSKRFPQSLLPREIEVKIGAGHIVSLLEGEVFPTMNWENLRKRFANGDAVVTEVKKWLVTDAFRK